MKYFLGYRNNGYTFTKIELNGLDMFHGDEYGILDITKFTLRFSNLEELNKYLINNNRIESKQELMYLVQKDSSKDESLTDFFKSRKIFFKKDEKYFDTKEIKRMLLSNQNNDSLYFALFIYLLKKTNFKNNLLNKFYEISGNPISLNYDINNASFSNFSKEFKSIIEKLKSYFRKEFYDTVNVTKIINDSTYIDLIDELIEYINDNEEDIYSLYKYISHNYKFPVMPTLSYADKLFINSNSINSQEDEMKFSNLIDEFLIEFLYSKTKTGESHLSQRSLFDLGAFLSNYFEKLNISYQIEAETHDNIDNLDFDENEDDVYLSKDDFKDGDPEEYGYSINGNQCVYRGNR